MSPAKWISAAGVWASGFASDHYVAVAVVGALVALELLLQWVLWMRRRYDRENR